MQRAGTGAGSVGYYCDSGIMRGDRDAHIKRKRKSLDVAAGCEGSSFNFLGDVA
jgi:hypothetical protein